MQGQDSSYRQRHEKVFVSGPVAYLCNAKGENCIEPKRCCCEASKCRTALVSQDACKQLPVV